MTVEIQNAANAAAEARQALEAAAAALAKGEEERALVAHRIAALDEEKAGILAQRKAGKDAPDHGAELARIAADREIIAEVMARRDADLAALRAAADEARRYLAFTEHELRRAAAFELQLRLLAHARRLDEFLLQTIAELGRVTESLEGAGYRPVWAPSTELDVALKKLSYKRATGGVRQ